MRNLIAFPLLGMMVILQSAVVSQVRLLSGYADLILVVLAAWALQSQVKSAWHWAATACVMTAFVGKMPWPVTVAGYLMVVYLAQILQKRVWQAPLLAMFSAVFAGTLFSHLLAFSVLRLAGTPLDPGEALGLVTLPSLLLNILIAIPLFTLIRDLAAWVYPQEEYV